MFYFHVIDFMSRVRSLKEVNRRSFKRTVKDKNRTNKRSPCPGLNCCDYDVAMVMLAVVSMFLDRTARDGYARTFRRIETPSVATEST